MNLPSAIRKDHNPLVSMGGHGAISLLTMIRWTSYGCPHCGHVFRRDYWPNKIRLGDGERTCRYCSKAFDDGTREWPQLSAEAKLCFFFPPAFLGIWGGLALTGIVSLFIGPRDEHSWPLAILFSVVPLILWHPLRMLWVLRSIARFKRDLRIRLVPEP
jgi:hypothetical protein